MSTPQTLRRKARRKAEAHGHDLERYRWTEWDWGFWEAGCRRCAYVSWVGQLYGDDCETYPLEAMTCEQIQQQYGADKS